jgi:hypothetical protein
MQVSQQSFNQRKTPLMVSLFILGDKDTDRSENLPVVFDHWAISFALFYYISREKNPNLCPHEKKNEHSL